MVEAEKLGMGLTYAGWTTTALAFWLGGLTYVLTSAPEGECEGICPWGIAQNLTAATAWVGATVLAVILGAILLWHGLRLIVTAQGWAWRHAGAAALTLLAWSMAATAWLMPFFFTDRPSVYLLASSAICLLSFGSLVLAIRTSAPRKPSREVATTSR